MPKAKKDTQKEVNDQRRSRRIAGLVPSLKADTEKSREETELPRNRKRMGAQVSLSLSQNETDGRPTKRSKQQDSHSNTVTGKARSQKGSGTTGSKQKGRRLSSETPKKASLNLKGTNSGINLQQSNKTQNSGSQESTKNLSVSLSCIETPSTSYSPSPSSLSKFKRRSERAAKGPYHSTPYATTEHTSTSNRSSKRHSLQSPFSDVSIVDETVSKQCDFKTVYPDPSEILEQHASQLAGTAPCVTPVSTEQRRSQRRSSISCRATRSNTGVPLSIVSPSTSYGSFAVPVKGQAFCECFGRKVDSRRGDFVCNCGEEDTDFNWFWDPETCSNACELSCDCRLAKFHLNYSCGTAACRGNRPMTDKQYFWEIKMTTSVYGTDMMIGVGTGEVNLNAHAQNFCSLLGRDFESWGLSYTGNLYHGGQSRPYGSKFGQGSIIGVHLDMWKGQLYFYKNRKPLGLACRGLYGKTLYPMISSTAARSAMKLTKAITCETTLQFFCCQVLRSHIPKHLGVVDVLQLPPGLRVFLENNFGWLLSSVDLNQPEDETF